MDREFFAGQPVPTYTILKGDCLERIKELEDCSIDSCVTDPPYHLQSIVDRFGGENSSPAKLGTDGLFQRSSRGFMGKSWDGGDIAFRIDLWKEIYRVLKPGAHMIAFGGTRTIHRITCAIEDSGFQVRDLLSWIFYTGFPKNYNIPKGIDSKVLLGSVGSQRWEELYELRPGESQEAPQLPSNGILSTKMGSGLDNQNIATEEARRWKGWGTALKPAQENAVLVRKPLEKGLTIAENVMKWGTGGINIDQSRVPPGDKRWMGPQNKLKVTTNKGAKFRIAHEQMDNGGFNDPEREHVLTPHSLGRWPANVFHFPKPSRAEKEQGLEHLESSTGFDVNGRKPENVGHQNPRAGTGRTATEIRNTHPTVKSLDLMSYLVNMVTPKGGLVLDPFLGSGSTMVSCILNDFDSIGMELTEEYWSIIEGRTAWALKQWKHNNSQYRLF